MQRTEPRSPRRPVHENGFTLVELLVVLTLMAMLLALSLPRYMGATDRARQKVRDQNIETLRDAIDKFKADQGRYPDDLGELVQRTYLRKLPIDPVTGSGKWILLAPPSGTELGVFDVEPPAGPDVGTSGDSSPAHSDGSGLAVETGPNP